MRLRLLRTWNRWLQRHPPALGWWLLGPALLVLLAALAAVSWTAYRSAQLAIHRFERQVAAEIGHGLETQLQALASEVSQTLNATRDALRRGLLRTDAADAMQ